MILFIDFNRKSETTFHFLRFVGRKKWKPVLRKNSG
nr:MAG TPA: hypothetical protein [Caudoviricetes sp.]